ncbi:chromate resistance protein ChrB domain-containing protein [Zoogloea sp.]|uniref:chromate resistance protein ChrB domain-containing protein n=1 Tax=Zoogloea sp. TaxID=49181 RepID=UPI001B650781|nr:chromate resistance protein ChrB domain-containing protein [Zoogloea sp.]MBK6653311.1 chromate resistance protein [Zoogloea sp.]MBK7847261.1 chromate resistance protein [Zoogloea sp.]MBP8134193.1 chromate resistance protein [Zoogloea sp.]HRH75589.1 chromate resistance protein [Zoogloea sp.]
MNQWRLLITSLPTENATARMRVWRALKASGAAVLRDGVYLMPEREVCCNALDSFAADILAAGGTAHVLRVEEPNGAAFVGLFDRRDDYSALLADISKAHTGLSAETAADTLKQARKLRKTFAGLAEIDFFPGEARRQTEAALQDLEQQADWALSPDEPRSIAGAIPQLPLGLYRRRTWATRRRPWVDRLASAWLIRRFIDSDAKLLWLESPTDCPADALGFDFDGATFSHVGVRVTFEVLLASFGLETPALQRLGALVHFLDVGGVQPPESVGIESALAGLRERIADDDQLLNLASTIFDGLLASFEKVPPAK